MVPMLLLHTQCCGSPLVCTPTVWHMLHTDQETVLTVQTAQTPYRSNVCTPTVWHILHTDQETVLTSDCTDSAHFSNRLHTDPMSAHPLSDTYCKHIRKQFWPFRLHRLYIDPSLHTHTRCRDKETWTCTPTVHCVKTLTAFCLPKCQNRKWRCACSVKEV